MADNKTLGNRIVATVGAFPGVWTFAGGDLSQNATRILEMGSNVSEEIMGSVQYSDITLTKFYVPEEDGAIEAWAELAEQGVALDIVVRTKTLDPSGFIPRALHSYSCKFKSQKMPEGTRDDSVKEISMTFSVKGRQSS